MLRLSMSELTTYRWSFEEDVTNYKAAGIHHIGVWQQKVADCGLDEAQRLLFDYGMSVSSLMWAGGFTGSDGRPHRDAVHDGLESIDVAAELQADCLIVYTGGRGGHTRSHARRLVRTALDEMAWYAEARGVTLAIEPMHAGCGLNWTFLTKLDASLEFLDQLRSQSVKLVLDTYHLAQDAAVLDHIPSLVPRLGLVQLGDARRPPCGEPNRCLLGRGTVPIHELLLALIENGYAGCCEVELMGEEIEEHDYWHLLEDSRRVLEDYVGASIGQ